MCVIETADLFQPGGQANAQFPIAVAGGFPAANLGDGGVRLAQGIEQVDQQMALIRRQFAALVEAPQGGQGGGAIAQTQREGHDLAIMLGPFAGPGQSLQSVQRLPVLVGPLLGVGEALEVVELIRFQALQPLQALDGRPQTVEAQGDRDVAIEGFHVIGMQIEIVL